MNRDPSTQEAAARVTSSGTNEPTLTPNAVADNADSLPSLSRADEQAVLLAARTATAPEPLSDEDAQAVLSWAARTSRGASLLAELLSGHILPVGIDNDGDPEFRPLTDVPPSPDVEAFTREVDRVSRSANPHRLRSIRLSTEATPLRLFSIAEALLLKFASATFLRSAPRKREASTQFHTWAHETRRDADYLDAILAGRALPMVTRPTVVKFRLNTEPRTPCAARKEA